MTRGAPGGVGWHPNDAAQGGSFGELKEVKMTRHESMITNPEELGAAYAQKNVEWYSFLIESCEAAISAMTIEIASAVPGEVLADNILESHPREIAKQRARIARYEKAIASLAG